MESLEIGPQWATTIAEDGFTDEKVWVASIDHEAGGLDLHVIRQLPGQRNGERGSCRNVSNPTGGEWKGSLKRYYIPVRFDENEVSEEDDVLFLSSAAARLIAKYADSPDAEQRASKGNKHAFIKKLADHARLRINSRTTRALWFWISHWSVPRPRWWRRVRGVPNRRFRRACIRRR